MTHAKSRLYWQDYPTDGEVNCKISQHHY